MPANNTHPHTQKMNNASTNKQMDIESVKHWQEGLDPPIKHYRDISVKDALVTRGLWPATPALIKVYEI